MATEDQDACVWTEDDDGIWTGSCGVVWVFTDAGPKENGACFCLGCGKKLVSHPRKDEDFS